MHQVYSLFACYIIVYYCPLENHQSPRHNSIKETINVLSCAIDTTGDGRICYNEFVAFETILRMPDSLYRVAFQVCTQDRVSTRPRKFFKIFHSQGLRMPGNVLKFFLRARGNPNSRGRVLRRPSGPWIPIKTFRILRNKNLVIRSKWLWTSKSIRCQKSFQYGRFQVCSNFSKILNFNFFSRTTSVTFQTRLLLVNHVGHLNTLSPILSSQSISSIDSILYTVQFNQ